MIFVTFRAIYGRAPSYICELINIKESGGYNLRSNEGGLLQAPIRFITHTTLGDRAFWLGCDTKTVEQLAG